jgi:hypothetical protein
MGASSQGVIREVTLLKFRGKGHKRPWWRQVEAGSRESLFFPGTFKPMLTYGKERTGDSQPPIIDYWGGPWVVPGLR